MSTVQFSRSLVCALALGFGAALSAEDATQRSAGQTLDDATITATVKAQLLADPATEGFDINVDTVSGVVTLRGGADNDADKQTAARIASAVHGVKRVNNEITVAAKGTDKRTEANTATLSGEARATAKDVAEETGDAWVTTKVKTQLLAATDIEGSAIDVKTENGVVHLSGTLPDATMKARAIEVARGTEGVLKVDAERLIASR